MNSECGDERQSLASNAFPPGPLLAPEQPGRTVLWEGVAGRIVVLAR